MAYSIQQANDHKINLFQLHVNNAKEKAKLAGMFTNDIKDELKNNILATYRDVSESEIIMTFNDPRIKYRTNEFDERDLIHSRIGVPIIRIIAGASFFGITDEQNKGYYIIEGYTTSELVSP